jgi:IS30 family transposase
MLTVTFDNGPEFLDCAGLERTLAELCGHPCGVCYAHPFSSCERGSNEIGNGILRRVVPKGTDFGKVTRKTLDGAVREINAMERKILGGLTASEAFAKDSGKAA